MSSPSTANVDFSSPSTAVLVGSTDRHGAIFNIARTVLAALSDGLTAMHTYEARRAKGEPHAVATRGLWAAGQR
jgi:hypothetical protein